MSEKRNPLEKIAERMKSRPPSSSQRGRREPVWKGPEIDGVTQSLLGRFLVCRERFRLLVVEGWKPREGWNHRLGYGEMWHLCEEELSKGLDPTGKESSEFFDRLDRFAVEQIKTFPMDREKIEHWHAVCRTQFPIYVEHWRKHPDNVERTPLVQEQVFDVPYGLPSGRTVRLRGKWDSVDLIREKKTAGVWLQENKTKGDVDPSALARQLTFDLQSMFYLVALGEHRRTANMMVKEENLLKTNLIRGVRYNVVRRPLSGGKGSIVRHKATKNKPAESWESFYGRLGEIIREDPDHFFCRFKVEVTPADVARFRRECLDPVLEQLCDWWDWISGGIGKADPFDPYASSPVHREQCGFGMVHFRFPYGVYNPALEGTTGDLDSYLETGSTTGLRRVDNLFPELGES